MRNEIRAAQASSPMAALGLACTLVLAGCDSRPAIITIDPDIAYQTISGWEVTAEILGNPGNPAFPYYRNEVYDLAVNVVGINRLRLEIRSGAENTNNAWADYSSRAIDYSAWKPRRYPTVNDNDDPSVINWAGFDFSELDFHIENAVVPVRQRLHEKGEKLFINLCYVAFTKQIKSGAYLHDDPEEYAEFVLATYLHMQEKYGFVPDAWEVILEPDIVPHWDGTLIGRAIVAAAKRLEAHGFEPRFIAPSVTDMKNAVPYFDQIATVDGALDYMVEFSYHRYRNRSKKTLGRIRSKAEEHGLDTSMLEWWFGKGNYEVLHEDLKLGRNSAWQGRVLTGLFDIDDQIPEKPIVTLRDDTRQNLQYFQYIRAGARRVEASSSKEVRFDPVAFINPDGTFVVVIKATSSGPFAVNGLAPGTYRVSFATEGISAHLNDLYVVEEGDSIESATLGPSVVTVYGVKATKVAGE